jgi:hypothetical protein
MLQMDIEGAEYRVLLDASEEVMKFFRIMLIEFHQLDRLFSAFGLQFIRATFLKLLRTHNLVHIHPNNCSKPMIWNDFSIPPVMEFTFHRRDRTTPEPGRILQFPHALDRNNVCSRPPVVLPSCWH